MHTYFRVALLLNFMWIATTFCTNKIVYLISPPRSLSVAFLRMMQARGDFSIMHEPSQLVYCLTNAPDLVQHWFRPSTLQSFDQVKKAILQEAEHHNVFVKEMSFVAREWHLHDLELMKNPNVYFVFLVRSVHDTVISMYNQSKDSFDIRAYHFCDLIGHKALYDIFNTVKHNAFNQPYLILTEDLYTSPHDTVQKFCDHVGIEFKPESLHWKDLGSSFDGQEQWHEIKHQALTHHWHGDAIHSTGFGKPRSYEVDKHGNPTFSEITNLEHREICAKAYQENLIYYCQLLEQ